MEPRRLRGLPRARIGGLEVPVARGPRARLLGLAFLSPADAGPGLLIPRCRSVHTFAMRFAIDVHFLDPELRVVAERRGVPPWRIVGCTRAWAVLELPAAGMCGGSGGRLTKNPSKEKR